MIIIVHFILWNYFNDLHESSPIVRTSNPKPNRWFHFLTAPNEHTHTHTVPIQEPNTHTHTTGKHRHFVYSFIYIYIYPHVVEDRGGGSRNQNQARTNHHSFSFIVLLNIVLNLMWEREKTEPSDSMSMHCVACLTSLTLSAVRLRIQHQQTNKSVIRWEHKLSSCVSMWFAPFAIFGCVCLWMCTLVWMYMALTHSPRELAHIIVATLTVTFW